MRDRKEEVKGRKEDIVEYTYHSGGLVRVVIGHGEPDENGNFVPTPNQHYEVRDIVGSNFTDLMSNQVIPGKPANVFRKDDLWIFVDRIRNGQTG